MLAFLFLPFVVFLLISFLIGFLSPKLSTIKRVFVFLGINIIVTSLAFFLEAVLWAYMGTWDGGPFRIIGMNLEQLQYFPAIYFIYFVMMLAGMGTQKLFSSNKK